MNIAQRALWFIVNNESQDAINPDAKAEDKGKQRADYVVARTSGKIIKHISIPAEKES